MRSYCRSSSGTRSCNMDGVCEWPPRRTAVPACSHMLIRTHQVNGRFCIHPGIAPASSGLPSALKLRRGSSSMPSTSRLVGRVSVNRQSSEIRARQVLPRSHSPSTGASTIERPHTCALLAPRIAQSAPFSFESPSYSAWALTGDQNSPMAGQTRLFPPNPKLHCGKPC